MAVTSPGFDLAIVLRGRVTFERLEAIQSCLLSVVSAHESSEILNHTESGERCFGASPAQLCD